jgi:bifunctional DNA-binding transcriptional regulator/antitoxin component of YhaV-PrlF toxin-antitoxin module
MSITLTKEMYDMDNSKIIRMSSKNQITIPKDFVQLLELGKEVECTVRDGEIVIRRLTRIQNEDFADLILQDLISEGYEGDELINKFRKVRSGMKSAVSHLVQDAIEYAKQDNRNAEERHNDVFGPRD